MAENQRKTGIFSPTLTPRISAFRAPNSVIFSLPWSSHCLLEYEAGHCDPGTTKHVLKGGFSDASVTIFRSLTYLEERPESRDTELEVRLAT